MPITFEGVSYSYTDPDRLERKRQKRTRKTKKTIDTAALEEAPSLEHGAPAWGTDPHAIRALRDINFTLEDGEFLGIAGHTGSGKSTLIQHMNGLMHPTRGRVLFGTEDLSNNKAAQACRGKVGVVFQYPEHQLFAATVYDDVAFGPRNLGVHDEELDQRVRTALHQVHLPFDDISDRSPFELSGGQQRRVAFAGVLAMEPEILILDEPVAGLDPVARTEFLNLIAELHVKGLTAAMVSHNMDDLARLSDRILVLNEGTQFALGTPSEIFTQVEALRSIGLDVPSAQKLAVELREEGFILPEALYDTELLACHLARELNTAAPDSSETILTDCRG